MWRIWRKEEELAFADGNVAEGGLGGGCAVAWGERVGGGVDDAEEHGAAVLVEELGGGVDMVVCSGVGTANDLEGWAVSGREGERSVGWIDGVWCDGACERTMTVMSLLYTQ